MTKRRVLAERYKKFRKMGEYSSHFGAAITREVDALQGLVATGVRRISRRGAKKSGDTPEPLPAGEQRDEG